MLRRTSLLFVACSVLLPGCRQKSRRVGKRLTWVLAVSWLCATRLPASITMSIDVLDGADPGAPSPAGLVIVDIGVDVSADDWFFNAAVVGHTFNGAALVYGASQEPNFPGPTFLPPGPENRFVSFGSVAYGRNDSPRFDPTGTVAEQTIEFYGDLPYPTLMMDEVGIGYYAAPLATPGNPDTPRGRDGYVARIALDITGVGLPGASDPANYRIFTPGLEPAGYDPVFVSEPLQAVDVGTFVSSYHQPGGASRNWGLYVPEPHSSGVLLIGALIVLRRVRAHPSIQGHEHVG